MELAVIPFAAGRRGMPDYSMKAKRRAWQRAKEAADAVEAAALGKKGKTRRAELPAKSGFYLIGFVMKTMPDMSVRHGYVSSDTSGMAMKVNESSGDFLTLLRYRKISR
jgi:hypothetical protein